MPDIIIPQYEPYIDDKTKRHICAYVHSGGWLTEYKLTREFERRIAEYVGSKHCTMFTSGTMALWALAYQYVTSFCGSIIPAFTMIATANAVRATQDGAYGLNINLADVDETLCLAETNWGPSYDYATTFFVSINGRAGCLVELSKDGRWLPTKGILIEDAAQSFGSWHKGKHLGTFGKAGVFSFSMSKVITTGNGGCVVTDDDGLAAELHRFRDFGRDKGGEDVYPGFGLNFKFTDLQAAAGLGQLETLPWRIERKREIYAHYHWHLADDAPVRFIPTNVNGSETTPWFVDILVDRRAELMAYLRERGIGTRPFYPALHETAHYASTQHFPNAEDAAHNGLWLPSSLTLTDAQIITVCDAIKEFYQA